MDARLAGGRALQAAYSARNQTMFDNDAILRSVMIAKSREGRLPGPGYVGSEPPGRVASEVAVPLRDAYSAVYGRGPSSVGSFGATSGSSKSTSLSLSSLERQYDALGNPLLSSFLTTENVGHLGRYGPSGRRALNAFLGREAFDTGYLEAPQ